MPEDHVTIEKIQNFVDHIADQYGLPLPLNAEEVYGAVCNMCGGELFEVFLHSDNETLVGIRCAECQKFYPRQIREENSITV